MARRGEIYYVDWSPGRGSEQAGIRPALIIQNDVGNQFSPTTIVPPITRNLGTVLIMAAMSETEIERFREVTLHPSAKLITRLPKGMSFVFSPTWYHEPFFVRHREITL